MGLADNYDHFAPEYLVDPFPLWMRMREEEPIARCENYDGFYVVTRYQDIREAAADPERFSSAKSNGIPTLPIVGMIPSDIDPPAQREYRRILNPALSVDAVKAREEEIRGIVVDLIEPLRGRGEFDAGLELARNVPPRATLGFIGFEREDWPTLIDAVEEITRLRSSDLDKVMTAAGALLGACQKLLAFRRNTPRHGDLMDLLLNGIYHDPERSEDRPLEDQEIVRMLAILLFGAIDTTSLAIAGVLHYLAQHRDAQDYLRQNGITPTAVEEMVRYTSPVQGLGRTVTRDTSLNGCPLHEDEKVLLMWASGNRQADVFPNPDDLDFERKPNPHLGFGHGPHKCVGLNLGKLMLRVTLEEFLARIGPFELADPDGVQYVGGETRGIRELPLRIVR